jgi:NAD(P)-dependent dehydrogenase (short-subunit alcohol dehydrogenase family)
MDISLADQLYIVAGASRGIGLAAAKALVRRRAKAVMLGRDTTALEEGAARLGLGAYPVTLDITDREALWRLFADTFEKFGRIDGIINNAGVVIPSRIETLKPADLLTQINGNFVAQVYACQGIIPYLRRMGGGRIINVTSAGARHPEEFSNVSIYFAAKAALERFTVELREEVKRDNICVTIFSPGSTRTSPGQGWDPVEAQLAMDGWVKKGAEGDSFMEPDTVGEAIVRCLETPPGCAYDLVELRPNRPALKYMLPPTN